MSDKKRILIVDDEADVRTYLKTLFEDADYDTIGGFVFRQLGRVPIEGDTFAWKQLHVTVLAADKRRIHKVKLEVDKTLSEPAVENG